MTGRIAREPTSHQDYHSKVERIWDSHLPGEAITHQRVEAFDQAANISFAPVEYQFTPIEDEVPNPAPSAPWIAREFKSFVRGEFGQSATKPWRGFDEAKLHLAPADDRLAESYLQRCEAELVFGGALQGVHALKLDSVDEVIYEILCADLLGNPLNRKNIQIEDFRQRIIHQMAQHLRLQFIFLGFPFKDQNPFRTATAPYAPDLAEIALLIRLHCLSIALYTVHPFGTDWIVATDGTAYSGIFGVDEAAPQRYLARLRRIRQELNLQGSVSFIDLVDLAQGLDGERHQGRFDQQRAEIRAGLNSLVGNDDDASRAMRTLQRGMAWNYGSRSLLERYALGLEGLWTIVADLDGSDADRHTQVAREEIFEQSRLAALDYAAFNLTLRWQDSIRRTFPDSIRATVHPKQGQVAIPAVGAGPFPWNGVGVVEEGELSSRSVSVWALHDLLRKSSSIEVGVNEQDEPVYYRRTP